MPHQQPWHRLLTRYYGEGCHFIPSDVDLVTPLFIGEKLAAIQKQLEAYFGQKPIPALTGRIRTLLYDRQHVGYLIPNSWLFESPMERRKELAQLSDFQLNFPLAEYLAALNRLNLEGEAEPGNPGLKAIFQYPFAYVRQLARSGGRAGVYGRLTGPSLLREKLNVEQWIEVMWAALHTRIPGNTSERDVRNMLNTAGTGARAYFELFLPSIYQWIDQVLSIGPEKAPIFTTDLERGFHALCETDESSISIDTILRGDWDASLPKAKLALLEGVRSTPPPPVSVFDRIDAYSHPSAPAAAPALPQEGSFAYLTAKDRAFLEDMIKGLADPRQQTALRYAEKLVSLLNTLMLPNLAWAQEQAIVRPVFPIVTTGNDKTEYQHFVAEQILFAKELPLLKDAIRKLNHLRTSGLVSDFDLSTEFFSKQAKRRWEKALAARRRSLSEYNLLRQDKLRQYGMAGHERDDHEFEMYLDEIIRIEKEVTPFIPFVRQAFKTVLPMRPTVTFNTNRHSIDGPEFDPDTLTQPEKYLRGEVMKTFRRQDNQVPILQVNAFCLDYSQSMTHEPMRNLLKIMFLLILGLEEHRTYDAIYFFGDEFMEVVDFSEGFTSRRIIFNILCQIAEKNGDKLWYRGKGYTNISGGVKHACARISKFRRELSAKNSDLHIVQSLFVLTDGEPNAGIWQPLALRDFIERKRREYDLTIKGIFLHTGDDVGDVVSTIFGPENTVETDNFKDAVMTFVGLMTRTYQEQRKQYVRATN